MRAYSSAESADELDEDVVVFEIESLPKIAGARWDRWRAEIRSDPLISRLSGYIMVALSVGLLQIELDLIFWNRKGSGRREEW